MQDSADYVITLEELAAMFAAQNIDPNEMADNEQDGSIYGKGFAQSGGVSGAVMRVLEEEGCDLSVSCKKCTGAKECKKALMILNAGRLPENLVEGMACEGGCIDGPASILSHQRIVKNRDKLLKNADQRTITENLEQHGFSRIKME